MIRHIDFFSAKDPADLARLEAGLKPLERIAAAARLEVRRNLACDQLGNEIQIVVYGAFADSTALDAYKADPLYAEAIRVVRPLPELRFAADIPSEDGPDKGGPVGGGGDGWAWSGRLQPGGSWPSAASAWFSSPAPGCPMPTHHRASPSPRPRTRRSAGR